MFSLSVWIEKLAAVPQTGKSIVHSIKMQAWKNEKNIYIYIKTKYFKAHISSL